MRDDFSTDGDEEMVSGCFKHIIFIVYFIFITSDTPQIIIRFQRLGTQKKHLGQY